MKPIVDASNFQKHCLANSRFQTSLFEEHWRILSCYPLVPSLLLLWENGTVETLIFLVFLLRELFSYHYFLIPLVRTLEKCTILLSFLCYQEISRQNKYFLVLNSVPCNGLTLLTESLSCSVLGSAAPLTYGSLLSWGLSLERTS